jgi:hypothetical protein
VVHVEGQTIGLRGRESGGIVDAEELVEEAGAFAALNVATAAAGVGVGVEWHVGKMRLWCWRLFWEGGADVRHELAAVMKYQGESVKRQ